MSSQPVWISSAVSGAVYIVCLVGVGNAELVLSLHFLIPLSRVVFT